MRNPQFGMIDQHRTNRDRTEPVNFRTIFQSMFHRLNFAVSFATNNYERLSAAKLW